MAYFLNFTGLTLSPKIYITVFLNCWLKKLKKISQKSRYSFERVLLIWAIEFLLVQSSITEIFRELFRVISLMTGPFSHIALFLQYIVDKIVLSRSIYTTQRMYFNLYRCFPYSSSNICVDKVSRFQEFKKNLLPKFCNSVLPKNMKKEKKSSKETLLIIFCT